MDSQHVRLLVNCYLNGWLTFQYPQKTSKLREDFILAEMKRKVMSEVFFLKTIKEAAVTGGLVTLNSKNADIPDSSYESYIRSLLPSLIAVSTIRKEMTKEDAAYYRQQDIELNKALKEQMAADAAKKVT